MLDYRNTKSYRSHVTMGSGLLKHHIIQVTAIHEIIKFLYIKLHNTTYIKHVPILIIKSEALKTCPDYEAS